MKEDLVNFKTRFKSRLFLEDKDLFPDDWKELVTSKYGEQMSGYNQSRHMDEGEQ
jgi:hypothetical protein